MREPMLVECPKAVREALSDSDDDRNFILDAVCYAGENNLRSSYATALEFGN